MTDMNTNRQTYRLAAILLFILAGVMPALAVDYGIMIGGVKVTSDNASNISGSASNITGTVKYNSSSNTLTLQNATIDCQNNNGMRFTGTFSQDLIINLVGTTTFKNVNGVGIYACLGNSSSTYKRVKFQGTGSLEIPAAICVEGSTNVLDFMESCTVKCTYCYSNVGGTLYVSNGATLHLYKGSSYAGSLRGFDSFYTIDGPEILIPEGASYNTSKKHLVDSNGNRVDGEVKIGPREYGITVGGVKVTSANKGKITGNTITGTVTYDANHKRLHLYNASIDASGSGIYNGMDGLSISCGGNCSISGSFPLDLEANTTLTGPESYDGKLTLRATNSPIWVGKDVNLTVQYINLVTRGATSSGAIRGYGSNSTLKFWSANLSILEAGSNPCIRGITGCTFIDDEVSTYGVRYRKELNGFGTESGLQTGSMSITRPETTYPIKVLGHQLNNVNATNFCYEGITGEVRYQLVSGTKHVLTFENVTADISDTNDACVNCTDTKPIEFRISGTNNLTNTYHAGISLKSDDVKFVGNGTLNMNGAIYSVNSSVGCDMLISCSLSASYIKGAGKGTLTIDGKYDPFYGNNPNVTVSLSGNRMNYNTAIYDFSDVELKGLEFLSPDRGRYDTSTRHVIDAYDNDWNGKVVIGEMDYGIRVGGVAVTSKNKDNVTGSNISGKVRFEYLDRIIHNKLHLENVTINNTQGYGIGNLSGKSLYINVEGDCVVKGTHAIYSENGIVINGSYSSSELNLIGSISGIVMRNNKELRIYYANVKASGATSSGCIRGDGHSKFVIDEGNLEVNSGSYPCMKGFDECDQIDTEVYWPEAVWFSRSLTGYGNTSGLTTGKLQLIRAREKYPISVAGHRLNDLNSMNFHYENTSGYLEYSPEGNLLVFVDFDADCEGNKGIEPISGKELNIVVEGGATFRNTDGAGIGSGLSFLDEDMDQDEEMDIYVDLNILGLGTLEMDGGIDIYGNLRITDEMTEDGEGPVVKATYIKGLGRKDATVSGSTVYLTGDGKNSTIRGFRSFGGEDCVFAQPIGATYSNGKLWKDGQVVTGNVIVCSHDEYTAINKTSLDGDLKVAATYDIVGRRTDVLRSGIVLQRMSDGTVRKQLVK